MKTMKKHLFLMIIAAAAVAFAGCKPEADEQDDTKPGTEQPGNGDNNGSSAMSIDKTTIDAAYTAGAYTIAVTSNIAWSATVNSEAATWCTLAGASGNSNGTVTVNIAANAATVTRTATVTLAAGTLTRAVNVAQAALTTPPHAASPNTWTFGEQTWSDAIQIPECNKTSFTDSYTDPHCRSYTENGKTWYFYNWSYVCTNEVMLCPTPWRVPSRSDFQLLVGNATVATLRTAWGDGGWCLSDRVDIGGEPELWSTTVYDGTTAYSIYEMYGEYQVARLNRDSGIQVRCVK
jgi:hypothetical protein